MIKSKVCLNTHQNGATKLCIDAKCDVSNPFICDDCEESHEHSGALVAVRIKKIIELKETMTNKQSEIKQKITEVGSVMN